MGMRNSNRPYILASIIILGCLSFWAFRYYQINYPPIPKELKTIKVAYQEDDITMKSLIDLAESKNWFKQEGLNLDRKTGLKGGISSYLISGQVDVSNNTISPVLTEFYAGKDVKVLALTDRWDPSQKLVSRYPKDELSKVQVASVTRIGGVYQNFMYIVLPPLGVDPTSLKYVANPLEQSVVALLKKGDIDLAFVTNKETYDKVKQDNNLHSVSLREVYKEKSSPIGLVTTTKLLDKKSAEIEKYYRVMNKSFLYFSDELHKKEMIKFLATKYGYSKADAESAYADFISERSGLNFNEPDVGLFKDIIASTKAISEPKNPNRDINELIDTRFKPQP